MTEDTHSAKRDEAAGVHKADGKESAPMAAKPREENAVLEMVKTIVSAVLIALFLRTVAYEPFNIPSESMLPTLLVGDYLFVSKFSYGYSHYSLPGSPDIFSGRLFSSQPDRGDVVVFRLPTNDKIDYIKRLVGLPGDTIEVKSGILYINGDPVKRERIDDFVSTDQFGNVRRIPQYKETMPNGGATYTTLDMRFNGDLDNYGPVTVPPGHYFMMGDNRDNSQDSRVSSVVGFVPAENLIGKAEILFFSTDGSAEVWEIWKWPFAWRWGRFFHLIN
jgi:signal peptidase I